MSTALRNLQKLIGLFLFLHIAYPIAHAQSADIAAKVTTCTACHGPNGNSTNDLWPNLAGQKKEYLAKQIRDFQSGQRKDPVMSPMAQTIAPEDIDSIATYFSKQKN